jgi:hypothetical protein
MDTCASATRARPAHISRCACLAQAVVWVVQLSGFGLNRANMLPFGSER